MSFGNAQFIFFCYFSIIKSCFMSQVGITGKVGRAGERGMFILGLLRD